jgi:hypothetical protein
MNIITELFVSFSNLGMTVNPPAREEEIIEAQNRLGLALPRLLLELYATSNGVNSDQESPYWNFWSCNKLMLEGNSGTLLITKLNGNSYKINRNNIICFSDIMFEAPVFGVNLEAGTPDFGAIIATTYAEEAFSSIEDFLACFVNSKSDFDVESNFYHDLIRTID